MPFIIPKVLPHYTHPTRTGGSGAAHGPSKPAPQTPAPPGQTAKTSQPDKGTNPPPKNATRKFLASFNRNSSPRKTSSQADAPAHVDGPASKPAAPGAKGPEASPPAAGGNGPPPPPDKNKPQPDGPDPPPSGEAKRPEARPPETGGNGPPSPPDKTSNKPRPDGPDRGPGDSQDIAREIKKAQREAMLMMITTVIGQYLMSIAQAAGNVITVAASYMRDAAGKQ